MLCQDPDQPIREIQRNRGQPFYVDDAGRGKPLLLTEAAEIGVFGDQNPPLQLRRAGVRGVGPAPQPCDLVDIDDVMAGIAQRGGLVPGHVLIEIEQHSRRAIFQAAYLRAA
jgi:hypothetical protein